MLFYVVWMTIASELTAGLAFLLALIDLNKTVNQ